MKLMRRWAAILVSSLVGPILAGCVFHADIGEANEAPQETEISLYPGIARFDGVTDFLFVIDNSSSMAEEQWNLAASASSLSLPDCHCDAEGLARLRNFVADNPDLRIQQWPHEFQVIYSECGLIERLQASRNDFRVGIITTDLNDCDQPIPSVGRGSVPQRGCLQASPHDAALRVFDRQTNDLAMHFADAMTHVGTFGSAYEKGLEAAKHFLTPHHSITPPDRCDNPFDCSGDLERFLRRDLVPNAVGQRVEAQLVVVFVTDEDDCSHNGAIDEGHYGSNDQCYTSPQALLGTDRYIEFFRNLKRDPGLVSVVLLAGLHDSGQGLLPSGCRVTSDDQAIATCQPARGNSVAVCDTCWHGQPVCSCHPAMICDGVTFEDSNCCQADPATRYHAVATAMQSYSLHSLCSRSYANILKSLLGAE